MEQNPVNSLFFAEPHESELTHIKIINAMGDPEKQVARGMNLDTSEIRLSIKLHKVPYTHRISIAQPSAKK